MAGNGEILTVKVVAAKARAEIYMGSAFLALFVIKLISAIFDTFPQPLNVTNAYRQIIDNAARRIVEP